MCLCVCLCVCFVHRVFCLVLRLLRFFWKTYGACARAVHLVGSFVSVCECASLKSAQQAQQRNTFSQAATLIGLATTKSVALLLRLLRFCGVPQQSRQSRKAWQ